MEEKIHDYLFAKSSFWEGVARLFDFGATMNEYNDDVLSPGEEDILAMESDWNLVAQDLKEAIEEYEKEIGYSR
jgi:hypothetical protein